MQPPFDPYQAWLGIAPEEAPPSHYRLLGVPEFTSDTDAIAEAAEQAAERLKSVRPGAQAGAQRKLLNQIEAAKGVLLNPTKKSLYDARLRASAARAGAKQDNGKQANGKPVNPAAATTTAITAVVTVQADDDDEEQEEESQSVDDGKVDSPDVVFSVAALAAKIKAMLLRGGARLAAIVSPKRREQIHRWASRTSAGIFLACVAGGLLACAVLGYITLRLFARGAPDVTLRPRLAAADLDADLAARGGRSTSPSPGPAGETSSSTASTESLLVARRLDHIRRALAERRIGLAKDHLAAAAEEPQSENQKTELTRLAALADLLEEFWSAVLTTAGSLKPGDEVPIAGQQAPITEATAESLTVQLGQFPMIFTGENMPIDLAIGLAAQQSTKNAAHAQAILGALQAMDAAGDRAEAQRLWKEAAAAGEPTAALAAEIETPLPSDAHVAARIGRSMNRPPLATSQAETKVASTSGAAKSVAALPAPPRPKRVAPDESRQQEIRAQFRQLYAAEFELAKDAGDKSRLAEKLLRLSGKFDSKPVDQFVLCNIARELATEAGDVSLALRAIDAQDRSFVINVFELKATVLEKISEGETSKKTKAAIVDASQPLIEQAIQADEIEAAARLLRAGLEIAANSDDPARAKELRIRQRELTALQKAFAEALPALERLRDDPTNPSANRIVGNWYCLQKGSWTRGMPFLAQGDDARQSELAKAELAAPTDPAQWQSLADGWQNLADGATGLAKLNLQRRVRYWCERLLPTLQGDAKAAAHARLAALPDLASLLEPPAAVGELQRFSGRFLTDGHGALAADGSKLLLLTDPQISIFDLSTGERRFLLPGHEKGLWDARLSADGRRVVSLGADNTLRVWDATNGALLHNFVAFLEGDTGHLVVSRDGAKAAFTTRQSKLAQVWDCEKGKRLQQFTAGTDGLAVRNLSADGRRALATGPGKAQIWDMLAGKEFASWDNRHLGTSSLGSLSSDGLVAVLSSGNHLSAWRVSDKKELARFPVSGSEITAVALSSDNRRALSGHADATVSLWDLANQIRLVQFKGHTGAVEAVTFTPDGRRALSSSADGTVRVWGLPR